MKSRDSTEFPQLYTRDVILGGTVTLWRNPADRPFEKEDVFQMSAPWNIPSDLPGAYSQVEAEEAELSRTHKLAWDSEFGYLSPDPLHCGTGLTIEGFFHLEGLSLIGDLEPVLNGIVAMRGAFLSLRRDDVNTPAHLFRIRNAATLGIAERQLLGRIRKLFEALITQEINARKVLLLDVPRTLEDAIARSLALLRSARFLSPGELLDLLSPIRIGVTMGLLDGLTRGELHKLMQQQIDAPIPPPPACADDDRRLDKRDAKLADWANQRFQTVHFNRRAEHFFYS